LNDVSAAASNLVHARRKPTKEAGRMLGISPRTVDFHSACWAPGTPPISSIKMLGE
jgi:hypothetical protein